MPATLVARRTWLSCILSITRGDGDAAPVVVVVGGVLPRAQVWDLRLLSCDADLRAKWLPRAGATCSAAGAGRAGIEGGGAPGGVAQAGWTPGAAETRLGKRCCTRINLIPLPLAASFKFKEDGPVSGSCNQQDPPECWLALSKFHLEDLAVKS